MEYPLKIIESRLDSRQQFQMTDGTQPTHALFYLKKGNFTMEIDGVKQQISHGDCVIFPDYIHFKRSVSRKITFVYIKFAVTDLSFAHSGLPYGKIEFKDRKRFESTISILEGLLDDDSKFSANYRNHLLCDILFQAANENTGNFSSKANDIERDDLLSKASEYIQSNISGKISTADICRHCSTNASTLNYRFRKVTGKSTGMYICHLRMKKARRLLISTTYSIKEIASKCGYEEVYYFSNAFKKHHGVSPNQYRKNL